VSEDVYQNPARVTRVRAPIGRPRLVERLNREWPASLLVVTAPAGFGKTTTVEAFLAGGDARTIWIGLDEDDNDAVLLWSRILAETRSEYGIGSKAGAALATALGSPRPAIEQLAAELRQAGGSFVIVLDDLHLIDDPACLRSIELGRRLLAPEVSWVLLSRQEPTLPLERLRGRGQLVRLGPRELAFDREETAKLLARFELRLGATEVDAVHEATGGWPAAVYMSALWLRDAADPAAAALGLAPADGELTDYLLREVIGGLDPELRTFLRRSSVLPRVSGRLCDEVLQRKGSAGVVEQLREESLLVRGERSRNGWYRYHALLRGALLGELEEAEPGAAAAMHRRAAAWFLREGMPEDAAEHAREAGEFEMLADLLAEQHLPMMRKGRSTTLLRWAAALPAAVLGGRPDVTIATAMAAEVAARPSLEIRRLLAAADLAREGRYAAWSAENEVEWQLLTAGATEAGVGASVAAARAAVAVANESVAELAQVSGAVLSMFLEMAGEHEEAEAVALAVIEDPAVVARPFALLFAEGTLALVELGRGRPRLAAPHVERAMAVIAMAGIEEGPIAARVYDCEALLALAEGELAAARRAAERSLENPFDTAPLLGWTLLVAADVRARTGDFGAAREALDHAGELIERSPDPGRILAMHEEIGARVAVSEAAGGILAEPVSPAEMRVLRLLADGLTRPQIATALVVSVNTVKTHQRSLYRKLGAGDRETVVGRARSHGLLERPVAEVDSPG
jgi:LuxR family transcriptional regulator, maltose regulon positive regulatory protein